MTRTNANFALAYLFLVALPVLVLVGVLRSGDNLIAPISVGGPWRIQTVENNFAGLPCGKSLAVRDAGFTVSQSGKNFTLSFDNSLASSASGTIEGTTIKASMSPSAALVGDAGCGAERVLFLTATLDSKVNPQSLLGMLSVKNCPTCAPVRFLAIREDQAKAKEGH